MGELAWDLPHLVGSLCAGEVSLDKVRAVADVATPETDRELLERAQECSVRQLADLARASCATVSLPATRSEHDRRILALQRALPHHDASQLPPESFAETRTCLEARARQVPSDGETRWDQRLCDAFLELIRSATGRSSAAPATSSPYLRRRPRPPRRPRR